VRWLTTSSPPSSMKRCGSRQEFEVNEVETDTRLLEGRWHRIQGASIGVEVEFLEADALAAGLPEPLRQAFLAHPRNAPLRTSTWPGSRAARHRLRPATARS
jgi:hypothetical protein